MSGDGSLGNVMVEKDYGGYQHAKTLNFNIFVDNLIFIRIFAAPKLWGNEHKLFINKHLCLQFNN